MAADNRRVAVVTGGGNGIGAAIAQALDAAGCHVIVADLNAPAAHEVAAMLAHGTVIPVDTGDAASVAALFDQLDSDFGRCDVLVNNAGIALAGGFLDYPLEQWRRVMAVNLDGPMLACQRAAQLMRRHGWGRIVNITSISGERASVGRSAYGTSKAALAALTRQIAIELADFGITANCVAPGPVDTPLTRAHHPAATRAAYHQSVPLRRYGAPAEIAQAVAFLCSEQAGYITGHTLAVDGGFLAAGLLTF